MLYSGKTWAPNDCQIYGVKAMDGVTSEDSLAKLYLFDATVKLRICHLSWFGPVKHSDYISPVMDMALLGRGARVDYSKPLKPVGRVT